MPAGTGCFWVLKYVKNIVGWSPSLECVLPKMIIPQQVITGRRLCRLRIPKRMLGGELFHFPSETTPARAHQWGVPEMLL